MAVAEIFSIREYAWKMRGVDYEKCWPFLEDRKGRSLPPMTVPKFQWWADDLREVRSVVEATDDLDLHKVSIDAAAVRVQVNISAETSGVDLERDREASAEERQESTRPPNSRAKQRAPKKRSIIELFEVAPPIGSIHEEDHQDHRRGGVTQQRSAVPSHSSLRGGDGIEIRERKKRNKDGSCRKMLMDKIGAKKKLKPKTKHMKKHKQDEIRAAKKEETCKLYMSSPAEVYKILRSKMHEKQFIKMHKKLVHKQVKTATMRTLLKKHIFRFAQTSKFVPRNLGVTRIPPGITRVKKRKWGNSTKKRKKREKTLDSHFVELFHEPTKNLTVSGKDDTLVNSRGSLPMQLPHLGALCKIVSDVLAASSTMESLSRYPSTSEGVQLNTIDEQETQISMNGKRLITNNIPPSETSSEKQFNGCFVHASANSSITKRTPTIEILDLNHPVNENVDLNCICQDGFTSTPSSNCSVDMNNLGPVNDGRLDPETRAYQEQSLSISADHTNRSKNLIGKGISVSNACNAPSLLRNQDSLSCLDQSCLNQIVGSTHPMCQVIDACNDFPKFHKSYQLEKDTLTGTRSSGYSKTSVEPTSIGGPIRKDKFNEGFIGLPLNSQGELIQFHPRTRYDSCEIDKVSKPQLNSVQFFPSTSHFQPHLSYIWTGGKFPFISSNHDADQNWLLKQYNPPRQAVLSDLCSVELQALEKLKNQTYDEKVQFNHYDPGQLEFSHPTCRDHIITESCSDRIKFRSDRDFELGMQSSIQPTTMRLMGKNVTVGSHNKEYHATSGHKLRMYKPVSKRWPHEDCIVQTQPGSIEIPSNFCSILPEKCTPDCMHLGFGYDWMLNDGCSSTIEDCGFHFDLSQSFVPSQSFLNSHSTVHGRMETQSVDVEQRKMFLGPYPPNIRRHMLVNSNNCKHGQSLSYSVPSTSPPAYLSQVSAQASRATPIQKLPQWMQDSTSPHHFIHYPTSMYDSHNMEANSGYPHTSMPPRPVVSFPSSSNGSSHTYESYAPISMYDPSSIAGSATKNFSFTSSNHGDKIKINYGGGFIFVHNNSQDHSNKGRKRFAPADQKDRDKAKRPNLKLQKDLNFTASASREQPIEQKDNTVASEVNACVGSAVNVSCPVTDNEKDNVVAPGGFVCSKSSHKRSGPVKLSAGTKHILRPNGSLDQNSPPIYSTVYFTQATSSSNDAKEKAAKVYRF